MRRQRDRVLGGFLDTLDFPPDLRAILEAWAEHRPMDVRVGDFEITDACIDDSLRLPRWVKDGPGHEDGCYEDGVRGDVIVLGRERSRYVVVEHHGGVVQPRLIVIDGWNHISGTPDFEVYLADAHLEALDTGKPSALTRSLKG